MVCKLLTKMRKEQKDFLGVHTPVPKLGKERYLRRDAGTGLITIFVRGKS